MLTLKALRRHDKSLNGLVDLVLQIVLQTFDGLRLAKHTLPSSLQPLFFAASVNLLPMA